MSISYDNVKGVGKLCAELTGENRKKASLKRTWGAMKLINSSQGRIFIKFSEPISLKSFS